MMLLAFIVLVVWISLVVIVIYHYSGDRYD